jgi:hypothetical protein
MKQEKVERKENKPEKTGPNARPASDEENKVMVG